MSNQPTAPNMRTFTLKSPEAYEALRTPRDRPWIEAGALPRDPLWPRKPVRVAVQAGTQSDANDAFAQWQRHVDAGHFGPDSPKD